MKVAINIMLVGIVLSLLVGVSGATWCDTDYAKRINVSVNNTAGSALTNYQVYVNLSANPINETSLRVYNSTSCTLRPHWTENETSGNSYGVWINYSVIAASMWVNNTAIYYDNVAASSTSSGDNTFEFFDDFEDGAFILGGWDRYASNPILEKNGSGWEQTGVYVPRILKNLDGTVYKDGSNQYWMYYSGAQPTTPGTADQAGLAYSTDLYSWTREATNPVLPFGPVGYDYGDVVMITVLKDGSTWHTWYESNSQRTGSDYVTISYANSTDGISWTKNASNPILSQGSGDDSADLYSPAVILDGSTWKMWYIGHNAAAEYGIMYATADYPEGPWTKYSNSYIFEPAESVGAVSEVWKDGSTYYMTLLSSSSDPWDIKYATSSDGITWSIQGTTFKEGASGEWDDTRVYWSSQVNISGTWYSFYTGYNVTGTDWSIGVATSSERIVPITEKWDTAEAGWSVQDSVKYAGIYAAKATSNASQGYVLNKNWTYTSGVVSVRYRPESLGLPDTIFYVHRPSDSSGFLYWIEAYEGHYKYHDGSNWNNFPTDTLYTLGAWDLIELAFDYGTDKYHVWVNGTKISGAGLTIVGAGTELIKLVSICQATATDINYFDNYFVRKYTSSEPAVTLGSEEDAPESTPVISNVANGSISPTSQWIDWDVNQTAHNRVLYSNQSDLTPAWYSTWDNSTAAPNITLSGLDASTQYWYQVWSYNTTNTSLSDNSSTLSFTTTSVDTSFTVTLPSGYTHLKFEPSNSTAQNVTPNGQTDSQEFYNVTNTGNVNLDIRLQLNETVSNIVLKADSDNNPLGAKEVNTTLVTIYSDLATTNSADIWLWSDFSHTVEQDTNKTINVNVTQST